MKLKKILKKIVLLGGAAYILLFIVFFFDLDGKILFNFVEPRLKNHYDKMPRKDPVKQGYGMNKPWFEYDINEED